MMCEKILVKISPENLTIQFLGHSDKYFCQFLSTLIQTNCFLIGVKPLVYSGDTLICFDDVVEFTSFLNVLSLIVEEYSEKLKLEEI